MAVVLTGIVGAYVVAAEPSLVNCAAIEQSQERLDCFDALSAKPVNLAQSNTTIKQLGRWEVREKVNSSGDIEQISVLLDADFGQSSLGKNISMVMRCRSNLTDMYIIWGDSLDQENIPVVVKLGNEAVQTEIWERSKSLKTSFRDRATHLIRKMMLHEKAVFQVKRGNDPITAVFDINGLRKVIRPIRELCNWTH